MQVLTIAGTVGKDAVLRTTQNNEDVLSFSLAVSNGKDRDPTWYDCSIWGKRAKALEPYIKKGGRLALSGRPSVRVHEGKAYPGISASEVELLGGAKPDDSRGESAGGVSGRGGAGGYPQPGGGGAAEAPDLNDPIPF